MRKKKPRRASPDEVKISRSGEEAIIAFADATISTTHLRIGPRVHEMSDQAILDIFNDVMAAQDQLVAEWENIVVEIPPGRPQIKYSVSATSGYRAATCFAAISTTAAQTGRSPFKSMIGNCRFGSSDGFS